MQKTYQVVAKRRALGGTMNLYVTAQHPVTARIKARRRLHDVKANAQIIGVREMRDTATAHNHSSIFANGARFVA